MINRAMAGPFDRDPFSRPFERVEQLIPASLQPNAIALYTTRPTGLSDFAVDMTNAVTNGDFSNGTTGWAGAFGTITATGNVLSSIADGSNAANRAYQVTTTPRVINTKFAGILKVRALSSGCISIQLTLRDAALGNSIAAATINNPIANQWYSISGIATLLNSGGLNTVVITQTYADATTANGKVMEVQEVMCIDLSTPFSLSNEPTAAEFSDMLAYKGKTFWNGTEPVVINPNDKYYWPDRSGFGRHLHAVNVAYDATGGVQVGPPANWLCDGVNDYLVYNSAADIVAANGAVSAFVVFQAKDAVINPHRVMYLSSKTLDKHVIGFYVVPTEFDCLSSDSVSGNSTAFSTRTVSPNTWYSVYTHYDPTDKKPAIAVNAGTVSKGTALTNGTVASGKIALAINPFTLGTPTNTREAEVYLFNKVLTLAEIKQLHNNIASRYGLTKV